MQINGPKCHLRTLQHVSVASSFTSVNSTVWGVGGVKDLATQANFRLVKITELLGQPKAGTYTIWAGGMWARCSPLHEGIRIHFPLTVRNLIPGN